MTPTPGLILSAAALVLAIGVWGSAVLIDARTRSGAHLDAAGAIGSRSASRGSALDRWLRGTRYGRRLQARVAGAGLSWSPGRYLATVLLAMVVVLVVGLPLVGRISTILFVIGVPLLASRILQHLVVRRTDRFITQLPEIARLLANASSAGLSVQRGLEMAATEISSPASQELSIVVNQLRVGRSLPFTLDDLATRLPSRELNVLVRTLVIQSRSGGTLVRALQDIARSLDDRKQLRREAKTAASGSVFGGYLVIGLGLGSVVVANIASPGVIDELASVFLGRIALIAAFTLFVIGFFLMRFLTRVDV